MLFERDDHEVTSAVRVRRTPYLHCVFPPGGILSAEDVAALLDSFPEDLMRVPDLRTSGSDKNYFVSHLDVFDRGRWTTPLDALHEVWRTLVRYLVGPDYDRAIRGLLELGDIPISIEVRISIYPRAGWMSRHTDRADKLFSHNIYLCPDWEPAWGGELALYDTADSPQPARVVHPDRGNAVAFRRSDSSWHEVMPVAEHAGRPRCAVLVHGYHVPGTPTPTTHQHPEASR